MCTKRLDRVINTVLSGSANKNGNTNFIIEKLFPDSRVIYLSNKNISPCLGCHKCEEKKCVFNDDFDEIINEIEIGNNFILVSPIYFLGFPSFVKAFIDRFQIFWQNGFKDRIKYCAIILHGEKGNYAAEDGLKFLSDTICKILNCENTFFTILHNFNLKDKKLVENKVIEVREQLWNAFFVK